jgi:hypothetical protein
MNFSTGINVPVGPTCEGKFSLRDSQLSASTEWAKNHGALNAKLHHQAGGGKTGAWSARHNDKNQWLQVDLGKISKVTRVSTQGRTDSNQWVKSYTIEYSVYGSAYIPYKVNGAEQVSKCVSPLKGMYFTFIYCYLQRGAASYNVVNS